MAAIKILITGICGFVGSTLASEFLQQKEGIEIFGIDNLVRAGSWRNKEILEKLGVKFFHGDLRLPSDLEVLPCVDWVIDAAANASVLAGVDGKTSSRQLLENNLYSTINLLEYCKQHKAGFNLLSTSRVYSINALAALKMGIKNDGYEPISEQQFPYGITLKGINEAYATSAPISLYGSTKLSSEQLALEYGYTYDFPVWINRCGVMAGAGQFGHPGQGIFAYWIHSFRERRPLKYIGFDGNGYQVRDCMHPRDLISLFLKQFSESLDTKKARILNLSGGSSNSMSLKQLSTWCSNRFEPLEVEHSSSHRAFDIPWMVLDHSAATKTWNWEPSTNIIKVLEEIADFSITQRDWCKVSGQ